ncbi:MAG: SusC/RagA family TonB-linked outer membrane protein [Marinifilaceae bacterium]|nr:SusC/RagA family TonB-linked outer membrane protein [Marinifilaceae bacterium]
MKRRTVRLVSILCCATMLLLGHSYAQAQQDSTKSVRAIGMAPVGNAQVQSSQTMPLVTIRGTVMDESGQSVIGASVYLKDAPGIGIAADIDGKFSLSIPWTPNTIIVVSSVGYETQEVKVTSPTKPLEITLVETSQMLKETVVTGYFNRSMESFTGSAVTVTAKELQAIGNQNIIESLKNIDPAFVVGDSYELGSNPNQFNEINIRGKSSFAGLQSEYDGNPNEPLFILDGFETTKTAVFDLDMNRVASVTILKDAAAKAIYGSKAANGVIVIETVAPTAGALRVNYQGNVSIEMPDLTSYDLTDAREKLQVEWDAGRYSSSSPSQQQALEEQYNELLKNVERGVNTYWLEKPLRVGVGNKHTLFFEGGDEAMRYGATIMYNNIAGAMKGSDRNTIQGNITLSYRVRNLMFRNSLSITHNKAVESPYGNFSEYARLNPYYSPYDENGNINKLLGTFQLPSFGSTPRYYYNPLYNATIGTKNESQYTDITENFYIEWQAHKNLRLTGRVGYNYQTTASDNFLPGNHTSFSQWTGDMYYKRGSYTKTNGYSQRISVDLTANWSKTIKKHMIFINGGYNLAMANSDNVGMTAWGFLNNRVDHITFAKQFADNGVPTGSESITREIGFIGAANYSYDDRYLADISVRASGSSVFGSNKRWGTFWAAGLGWNLHKEHFMENAAWLSKFKLRGSIGYTGSQSFSPYQAMSTYKFYQDLMYDNINGAYLMALANDELKWQQTRDINVGLDMGIGAGINLRVDGYVSTTNDQLISITLPSSSGFNSYTGNLGNVVNKGIEGVLNWRVYNNPKKQAYITLNGTLGHNVNTIENISDALKSFNDAQESDQIEDGTTSPLVRYEEGQSMSVIWVVKSLGIDPVTGRELFVKKDGTTTYDWTSDDYVVGGDSNPKVHGNFGVSGEYKGFGFNLSFSYKLGGDYYNQTRVDKVENVDIAYNVDRRVLKDTWKNPGDVATFKKITSTPTTTYPTSRFVEKNNELQFASLNLYYDFKFLNLRKAGIERLKVNFYMNDICRISTVKTERGTSYPFARNCSVAVSATF